MPIGLGFGMVRLTSNSGSYSGVVRIEKIKPGNLQVHWPEGNCLLSREEIDIASREPDYNAMVTVGRTTGDFTDNELNPVRREVRNRSGCE
jgi:hypothetical protein